jgi:hypothetical protein
MVILAHPNIWVEYIKFKGKNIPSQNFMKLFNIIHNNENVFAYKYTWNSFYEGILEQAQDDEIDYIDVFNNIIVDFSNNDKLILEYYDVISSNQDFENCFNLSDQLQFLLLNNQLALNPILENKGVLVLNKIVQPNRHWIYYSILISNQSTHQSLDYRDFRSDFEIQNFIKCILNLKNPNNKKVFIQSDYLNYGALFELVKGKSITYCSSQYSGLNVKKSNELSTEKNSVRTYFGSNSSYRVSTNKGVLHPRAIFYNNIIITLNHDFPQISVVNSNWRITFHYCKKTYDEKLGIISNYKSI